MNTLRELQIGDRFYPASKRMKATAIFKVVGNPEFNAGHGSSTRKCIDLAKGIEVNKSCRANVIRIIPKGF